MSDYISKTLLLHDIAVVASMMNDPIKIYDQMSAIVKESPAADVVERKHGKWLDVTTLDNEFICWVCSECRHGADFVYEPYNFCPNCGADMRVDNGACSANETSEKVQGGE